jgi:hypothetical protein
MPRSCTIRMKSDLKPAISPLDEFVREGPRV